MGHPSWDCSRANSLNFEVPMESEASEFPKGLVLGRDENIHIRLTGSTPLGRGGHLELKIKIEIEIRIKSNRTERFGFEVLKRFRF